ncbi:MAG: VWA domain-containing protein [Vicinamibacterales bacterium]
MRRSRSLALAAAAAAVLLMNAHARAQGGQQDQRQSGNTDQQSFRFKTGVELINVTATVTDENGRFVSGLHKEDFRVYQDNELQEVTHFTNERVPVSLGIVLDTSGSMEGEKMNAAREALNSFLEQLNDPDDEVFLYRFDNHPVLVEGWTRDKQRLSYALSRMQPRGGTALYDAVADAVPLALSGHNRKKAIVIISDGNDTSSRTDVQALKRMIREAEVLVYAIGIDSQSEFGGWIPGGFGRFQRPRTPRFPIPFPFPMPGGGGRNPPPPSPPSMPSPNPRNGGRMDDRVNAFALREITDDSGGRTEIVRSTRDLNPATTGIADELSRQYYLGYAATGAKDGKWHAIRVEVKNATYRVRARKGFVATP